MDDWKKRYEEQYRVSQGLAREVQDLRDHLQSKEKLLAEIAGDLKEMGALIDKIWQPNK